MNSLIEYHPGQSFLHRLDPRVKIIFLLLFTLVIFVVQRVHVAVAVFLTVVALWYLAGLPFRIMGGYLRMWGGLITFLFVGQAILRPGEVMLINPLIPTFVPLIGGKGNITEESVLFAFLIAARLLALIPILPLVNMTTPIHLFTLGLVRLGLPYQLAYTITTALNLIPTLRAEAETIMDAQKLRAFRIFERGSLIAKLRAYPLLVTPLVIGAMRRAQLTAVVMESRGFGAKRKRTYVEDIAMKPSDWVFMGLSALYCLAALLVNFLS